MELSTQKSGRSSWKAFGLLLMVSGHKANDDQQSCIKHNPVVFSAQNFTLFLL